MNASFAFGLVLVVGCAACSINTTNTGTGTASDPGTPVKQQPLAGTVDGHPFTGQTALAQLGFNGSTSRSITIYPVAATCANPPQMTAEGAIQILTDVDNWTSGTAFELGLSHSVTFVEQKGGAPDNLVVTTGRVEVTSANQLSLRATSSEFGNVEGQVPVIDCTQQ